MLFTALISTALLENRHGAWLCRLGGPQPLSTRLELQWSRMAAPCLGSLNATASPGWNALRVIAWSHGVLVVCSFLWWHPIQSPFPFSLSYHTSGNILMALAADIQTALLCMEAFLVFPTGLLLSELSFLFGCLHWLSCCCPSPCGAAKPPQ